MKITCYASASAWLVSVCVGGDLNDILATRFLICCLRFIAESNKWLCCVLRCHCVQRPMF